MGRTPLRIAVENDRLDAVRMLVAAGSNLFAQAADGESPATVAILKGAAATKAVFEGKGVSAKDSIGNTGLHYAAFRGDAAVVKTLVELGSSKTVRNVAGETPSDLARRWKKTDNDKLLQ